MCTEFHMQPNAHAKTGKCDPLFADLVTIALTKEASIYRRAWYVSAPLRIILQKCRMMPSPMV
jgi:hypothetical protein